MSLRYTEISAPTEASVPDVPSVPIGLRPGAVRDLDEIVLESANVREDPKAIDQRLLDKDDFDPDTCGYRAHVFWIFRHVQHIIQT
jgi:exocyst complex component 8